MQKQKTRPPVANELTDQATDEIRVYTLTREVDTDTPALENCLNNLKREYDFDMEAETVNIKDV